MLAMGLVGRVIEAELELEPEAEAVMLVPFFMDDIYALK